MEIPVEYDAQTSLTRKEASHLLGVTGRTVTRWVNSGILPAWKTEGGQNRISKKSVEALLQKRKKEMAASYTLKKTRILVVEDDPVLLEFYARAIESWGHAVQLDLAESGFDGMLQIGREKPDLIITDLKMPGMDGFQMIRVLKSKQEYASIQIVAVTALDSRQVAEQGGLPDSVLVFEKPAPMGQLQKLLRYYG